MYKNVASQDAPSLLAWDTGNNVPKTGDAANILLYVSIDDAAPVLLGAAGAASEKDATNSEGEYYSTDGPTQGETNGDKLVFSGKSSTANIYLSPVTVYTRPGSNAGILANTVLIEGVDATNQIRDSVLADSTLFNGAEVNALWDAFRNSIFHPKQDDWRLVLVSGSLPVGVSIDVYGTDSLLADDWNNAAGTLNNAGAWSDGAQQGALENTAIVLDFGGVNEFVSDVYIALEVSGDSQSTWTRAITWNLKGLKPSPTYIRIDGRFQYAGGSGLANNIVGVITSVEDTYLGTDYLGLLSADAQARPNLDVAIGTGGIPVGAFAANAITDASLAADAEAAIAAAVGAQIIETNGSITRQQAESLMLAVLLGETSSGGVVFKDPSGTTTRVTVVVNGSNERTSVTPAPSA